MAEKHSSALSDSQIFQLAWSVGDGSAAREESMQLLREFVRQARRNAVSPRLMEHMRDCVEAFLKGRKVLEPNERCDGKRTIQTPTLDKAFGLAAPGAGRPTIARDTLCEVAGQVLEEQLKGKTVTAAVAEVMQQRHRLRVAVTSRTQVKAAWNGNKMAAIAWVEANRPANVPGKFTAVETRRLIEICGEQWGFVLPNEEPFEGRHAFERARPSRKGRRIKVN